MHLNSLLLFKKYAIHYFQDDNKVLEIGCSGISEYQKAVRSNHKLIWQTLELVDSPNNLHGTENHIETKNEYSFPVPDSSFDIVVSGQVLEHVKKPWIWFKELRRIVKPCGIIITINPVSWSYHEDPVDCWRIYPEAIKALSEECSLKYEFSVFENLEWSYFKLNEKYFKKPNFVVPGKSIADDKGHLYKFNKQKYIYNKVLVNFPFFRRFLSTIQISYDTLSILKKDV